MGKKRWRWEWDDLAAQQKCLGDLRIHNKCSIDWLCRTIWWLFRSIRSNRNFASYGYYAGRWPEIMFIIWRWRHPPPMKKQSRWVIHLNVNNALMDSGLGGRGAMIAWLARWYRCKNIKNRMRMQAINLLWKSWKNARFLIYNQWSTRLVLNDGIRKIMPIYQQLTHQFNEQFKNEENVAPLNFGHSHTQHTAGIPVGAVYKFRPNKKQFTSKNMSTHRIIII